MLEKYSYIGGTLKSLCFVYCLIGFGLVYKKWSYVGCNYQAMTKTSDSTNGDDVEEKSGTSGTKTTVQSASFEIEKFDGTNNFDLSNVRFEMS